MPRGRKRRQRSEDAEGVAGEPWRRDVRWFQHKIPIAQYVIFDRDRGRDAPLTGRDLTVLVLYAVGLLAIPVVAYLLYSWVR